MFGLQYLGLRCLLCLNYVIVFMTFVVTPTFNEATKWEGGKI